MKKRVLFTLVFLLMGLFSLELSADIKNGAIGCDFDFVMKEKSMKRRFLAATSRILRRDTLLEKRYRNKKYAERVEIVFSYPKTIFEDSTSVFVQFHSSSFVETKYLFISIDSGLTSPFLEDKKVQFVRESVEIVFKQIKIELGLNEGDKLPLGYENNIILTLDSKKSFSKNSQKKSLEVLFVEAKKSQEGEAFLDKEPEVAKEPEIAKEKPMKNIFAEILKKVTSSQKRSEEVEFAKFRTSGLLGLVLFPSLNRHKLQKGRSWGFKQDSAVLAEKFAGSDGQYNISFDGYLLQQSLSFSGRSENWTLGVQLNTGYHLADIQMVRTSATPFSILTAGSMGYSIADTHLYLGNDTQALGFDIRSYGQIKFASGSQKNLLSSGRADMLLGVELGKSILDYRLVSMLSYGVPGDIAIFKNNIKFQSKNFFTLNMGGSKRIEALEANFSTTLNVSQNPLSNALNMNSMTSTLVSLGFYLSKNIFNRDIGLEMNIGLSDSTPGFTLGYSLTL